MSGRIGVGFAQEGCGVFANEAVGQAVEVDYTGDHIDGYGIHANPDKGLGPFLPSHDIN